MDAARVSPVARPAVTGRDGAAPGPAARPTQDTWTGPRNLPSTGWKEVYAGGSPAAEAAQFERFAQEIQELQNTLAAGNKTPVQRAFHAKALGAVEGEFRISGDIPAFARQALFKAPGTYKALVRFSNGVGFRQSDRSADVRGLAVSIEGPGGKQQDFLTTNQPVSLARNAGEFMAFAMGTANLPTMPITLVRELGVKRAVQILWFLATKTTRHIDSMAKEQFWSGAPIKYGPYAVKLSFRPQTAPGAPLAKSKDAEYLSQDLRDRLAKSDIVYDVGVQFYVDEARTPIENSNQEWTEKDAPFVKVGELVLPRQDLRSPAATAAAQRIEAHNFSPWHTDEMRPLGNLMRARKAVYDASAAHRGAPALVREK